MANEHLAKDKILNWFVPKLVGAFNLHHIKLGYIEATRLQLL
jgi:hypothetical protein